MRDFCPTCHKRVRVSVKGLLYRHYPKGVGPVSRNYSHECSGSYVVCSHEQGVQEKMLSLKARIEDAIRVVESSGE